MEDNEQKYVTTSVNITPRQKKIIQEILNKKLSEVVRKQLDKYLRKEETLNEIEQAISYFQKDPDVEINSLSDLEDYIKL